MKNGPYILKVAPSDYPGLRYRGRYVYEHHLVWWTCTGELVPPGYVIHHRDENKHNNSPENLELKTRSEHSAEHAATGRTTIALQCGWCGVNFEREVRQVKVGQVNFYCTRSCQVRMQHHDRKWH